MISHLSTYSMDYPEVNFGHGIQVCFIFKTYKHSLQLTTILMVTNANFNLENDFNMLLLLTLLGTLIPMFRKHRLPEKIMVEDIYPTAVYASNGVALAYPTAGYTRSGSLLVYPMAVYTRSISRLQYPMAVHPRFISLLAHPTAVYMHDWHTQLLSIQLRC